MQSRNDGKEIPAPAAADAARRGDGAPYAGQASNNFAAIGGYSRVLATALDERDSDTRRHCDRVAELGTELGRCCRLNSRELRALRQSALLHDIGKIGVPDCVLLKPGSLEGEELLEMRLHPERGQRIVLAIGIEGIEEIALAVRHHHESFDGSGYPDGLGGEAIPYLSRLLTIVDAYDAMRVVRPYQLHRSHAQIMGILGDEGGRKFDPYVLARFREMMTGGRAPARS